LIGELDCEISLLPNKRTVASWARSDMYVTVIRCKDAMISAQKCALRLHLLDTIDAYSAGWVDEVIERCDEYQSLLAFVEEDLMRLTL
jgi:hypothetical protein